jgi:hypothetical protein
MARIVIKDADLRGKFKQITVVEPAAQIAIRAERSRFIGLQVVLTQGGTKKEYFHRDSIRRIMD